MSEEQRKFWSRAVELADEYAKLIEDRGQCVIDTRAIATVPTIPGQSTHAAVQAFIFDRLREAGLPLPPLLDLSKPISERILWRMIQATVKAIGCTTIIAECHPQTHQISFRWR